MKYGADNDNNLVNIEPSKFLDNCPVTYIAKVCDCMIKTCFKRTLKICLRMCSAADGIQNILK